MTRRWNSPVWDGRVAHVMPERCSTCIFRPGNRMQLQAGRVKEMTDATDKADGNVTCHKTLGRNVGAICRGSYDRKPGTLLQIAERMGLVRFDGYGDECDDCHRTDGTHDPEVEH